MNSSTEPPEEIHNVSESQLSVARHFGGTYFRGVHYTYDPSSDKLIRSDILRAREAEAAKARKTQRQKDQDRAEQQQGKLF